jgi:hypothetical protein
MDTMSTVVIVKISNPKCTTTHAKDHSCEVSLLSDQTKYLFIFMVTMETAVIFKMPNYKCTYTHHRDHSCDVSLQSVHNCKLSWLPWQQWPCVTISFQKMIIIINGAKTIGL